jgi:hypothetical protein
MVMFANLTFFVSSKFATNIDRVASIRVWNRGTKVKVKDMRNRSVVGPKG